MFAVKLHVSAQERHFAIGVVARRSLLAAGKFVPVQMSCACRAANHGGWVLDLAGSATGSCYCGATAAGCLLLWVLKVARLCMRVASGLSSSAL